MTQTDDLTPVAMLQTDTFCACGYNLHSQAVLRDSRLKVLVCRCPECGNFTATGAGATLGNAWLTRAATAAVAAWIMCLLGLFGLAIFLLAALPSSYVHLFLGYQYVQYVAPSPITGTMPYANYHNHPIIVDIATMNPSERREVLTEAATFITLAIAVSIAVGIGVSVFQWHLRRTRLLALLLPLVAGAFSGFEWADNLNLTPEVVRWGEARILALCLMEMVAIAIGLGCGRFVARWIVRLLAPPKLAQHLAFLWLADGKTPPPITSSCDEKQTSA